MLELKPNREYKIRLVPNVKNMIDGQIIQKKYNFGPGFTRYFSYYMTDKGRVDIFVFGEKLRNFIQECITGYYVDKSNNYICSYGDDPEVYGYNEKKLKVIERINLFNIQSKYKLHIKTYNNRGYMDYDIKLIDDKSLWKPGDDQNAFKNKWDSVQHLNSYSENWLKTRNRKYKIESLLK